MANKSSLLELMTEYYVSRKEDPYKYFPESYNIKTLKDMSSHPVFKRIQEQMRSKNSIWICKPGENSNRGRGIRIFMKER